MKIRGAIREWKYQRWRKKHPVTMWDILLEQQRKIYANEKKAEH